MENILKKLRLKNNRVGIPPSLNKPNPKVPTMPDTVTHVYTRQYDTKGLSQKYVGPFPVISRPSRSTIEIEVGLNKDGSKRVELRHISDIKIAYLRDDATIATRPKRGRPPKSPNASGSPSKSPNASGSPSKIGHDVSDQQFSTSSDPTVSSDVNKDATTVKVDPPNLDSRKYNLRPRSKIVAAVSSRAGNSNWLTTHAEPTGPPPVLGFPRKMWSASIEDIAQLNRQIG